MKNAYSYPARIKVRDISEHMVWDVVEMVALGAASVAFGYLINILFF